MNNDGIHYTKDALFSYKAFLNFSISERGLGKTTCAKFWCIDDFLKTGNTFTWVRRYGTELFGDKKKGIEGCVPTFFDKMREFYPNHKLEIKGGRAIINGKIAGRFVSLATSDSIKSNDFPNCNKIIFDEFIIVEGTKHTYLRNECRVFLDLVSTVLRPFTDENGVEQLKGRVWLLANAITFANDYFFYFNIHPFHGKRFYHDKERGIVVEQCENKAYRERVRQSAFGKLIKGTTYESYAIDNNYLLDNKDFIAKRSKQSQIVFNIRYENQEWGVYADKKCVYISNSVDRDRGFYTFTKADHSIDSVMIKSVRGTRFEILIRAFQVGQVKCENIMIKKKFIDFIALFLSR